MKRIPALVVLLALLAGCLPYKGRPKDFVGTWRVHRDCGDEQLELRGNWTYVQSIQRRDGLNATHEGLWSVEGTRLTLEDGADWCGVFGTAMRDEPKIGDIVYSVQWEYGDVILEFNPDLDGFRKVRRSLRSGGRAPRRPRRSRRRRGARAR